MGEKKIHIFDDVLSTHVLCSLSALQKNVIVTMTPQVLAVTDFSQIRKLRLREVG